MNKKEAVVNASGHRLSISTDTGELRYSLNMMQNAFVCNNWIGVSYKYDKSDTEIIECPVNIIKKEVIPDGMKFIMQNRYAKLKGLWKIKDWGFELSTEVINLGNGIVHSVWNRFTGFEMIKEGTFAIPHGAGFTVPVSELTENQNIRLHYPVYCSMQWMDLYDSNNGFYIGTCDKHARSKFFISGRDNGMPYMEVCFPDICLKPQDSYILPALQIMAHKGDWRKGAAQYRQWFESTFIKPDSPDWCKRMPIWAWASCKGHYAHEPDMKYDRLPEHASQFFDLSIPVLQVSGYLNDGHDSTYPEYKASPAMGGEETLRKSSDKIHSQGGRLALYTNGRIVNPESSIINGSNWDQWCVTGLTLDHIAQLHSEYRYNDINTVLKKTDWDPDGTKLKEKYGNVDFAVMCPSSPGWRELFTEELVNLAKKYNLDGIYIDQVCGAWGLVCYSDMHTHKRPCDAWSGYTEFMSELRSQLLEVNSDTYIATEGVNDIIGLNIDLFQAHNWDFGIGLHGKGMPTPEIFITTLPNYLLYMGPVFINDYKELRRSFIYGRGIDIAIKELSECENDFIKELQFVMETRLKQCPQLLQAVPQPMINEERVKCFLYEISDSRNIILGASLDKGGTRDEVYIPGLIRFSNHSLRVDTPNGMEEGRCDVSGGFRIPKGSTIWSAEVL